jgi:hypothetical protein
MALAKKIVKYGLGISLAVIVLRHINSFDPVPFSAFFVVAAAGLGAFVWGTIKDDAYDWAKREIDRLKNEITELETELANYKNLKRSK